MPASSSNQWTDPFPLNWQKCSPLCLSSVNLTLSREKQTEIIRFHFSFYSCVRAIHPGSLIEISVFLFSSVRTFIGNAMWKSWLGAFGQRWLLWKPAWNHKFLFKFWPMLKVKRIEAGSGNEAPRQPRIISKLFFVHIANWRLEIVKLLD